LGMWLFLASEVLFFGGLFTAYAVMRGRAWSAFAHASRQLNEVLGGINTAVLLTSSLTMALAVWAAQSRERGLSQLFLGLAFLFGAGLLVIKAYEWHHEYERHLVPGEGFNRDEQGDPVLFEPDDWPVAEDKARQMQMFFVFYFTITGLHALHMIVGLGVL